MSDPFEMMTVHLLRGVTDRNVVVGPPLWDAQQGEYFIVACSKGAFHFDMVKVARGDKVTIEQVRDGFLADLARRPGLTVHAFDDEWKMIDACGFFWPCEGIQRLRTRFETENAFARLQARGALARH